MRPVSIDKKLFFAGYETGRRIRAQGGAKTVWPFKQIYIPGKYEIIADRDSITVRWVRTDSQSRYGLILVPGLSKVAITASADGYSFYYGICTDQAMYPSLITDPGIVVSSYFGIPTDERLTIKDPTNMDSFFIGEGVYQYPVGTVYIVQFDVGGQPPPLDALLTEDDEIMLTEDDEIINAY